MLEELEEKLQKILELTQEICAQDNNDEFDYADSARDIEHIINEII